MAAAAQCIGGESGTDCGTKWTMNGVYDGKTGMGQQMSALQIITANLISNVPAPVDEQHGGISKPNASFGTGVVDSGAALAVVSSKEKTGAICLTVGLVLWMVGGAWYVLFPLCGFLLHADLEQLAGFVLMNGGRRRESMARLFLKP